jgi:hypothetical protein
MLAWNTCMPKSWVGRRRSNSDLLNARAFRSMKSTFHRQLDIQLFTHKLPHSVAAAQPWSTREDALDLNGAHGFTQLDGRPDPCFRAEPGNGLSLQQPCCP